VLAMVPVVTILLMCWVLGCWSLCLLQVLRTIRQCSFCDSLLFLGIELDGVTFDWVKPTSQLLSQT
jgi:hypothetical protein